MATEYTCITRKIEVHLHCTDENKKELYGIWDTINDNLYKVANRIMSHYFLNDEYVSRLRAANPRYQEIEKSLKYRKRHKLTQEDIDALQQEKKQLDALFNDKKIEFLGTTQEHNTILRIIRKEFGDIIPNDVYDCIILEKVKYTSKRLDIQNGKCSVPNFRKGMPVPFRIKRGSERNVLAICRREDSSNQIYVKFPKDLEWDLHFGKDPSNNREIVERILKGEYDVGNSSIQQKNKKFFLNLVVKIPKSQVKRNMDRIVGIDLGVNIPLYAALNDNEHDRLRIGSREHFLNVRKRMNAKRHALQQDLRHSTNGGHGRKQKLQALDRFKSKERNWAHLQNHIFSKSVIEFAQKHNAGVIQMESLSDIGKDNDGEITYSGKFLTRYWSYFELQNCIEYKAKAIGIEVRYIDPYHTSQTCSFCGHYEKGQRISQSTFVCKNPDCEKGKGKKHSDGTYEGINADWNAARNIALSTKIVDR